MNSFNENINLKFESEANELKEQWEEDNFYLKKFNSFFENSIFQLKKTVSEQKQISNDLKKEIINENIFSSMVIKQILFYLDSFNKKMNFYERIFNEIKTSVLNIFNKEIDEYSIEMNNSIETIKELNKNSNYIPTRPNNSQRKPSIFK